MDTKLRRNELCIIGLPRCDFVFSSTRSCFIAYGFGTSALETTVLRALLEKRNIEPVDAGGTLAPGKYAFCSKICSKVITSQFCIVLLNSDTSAGQQVPNANVNMEYGLILGFNKYVIPFQREEQSLPFNVAGLDTVKYTNKNFESLASSAIDQAIIATTPVGTAPVEANQRIQTYLLSRDTTYARIDSEGDRSIYDLGSPLGFNLIIDFSGTKYRFLGNFTQLRAEVVLWRLKMLARAIHSRRSSWEQRINIGLLTKERADFVDQLFAGFEIWVIVNSDADRDTLRQTLKKDSIGYTVEIISLPDIDNALKALGGALG